MNIGIRTVLICLVGFFGRSAGAETLPACISKAATAFQVPEIVLESIIATEGGSVGAETRHSNGAVDLGAAQINVQHLGRLSRLGITRGQVRDDLCINVAVAAWHLRKDFDRTDVAMSRTARWVDAMLSYHSQTPKHRARYAGLLQQALRRKSHGM